MRISFCRCGQGVSPNASFCGACGEKLDHVVTAITCPRCSRTHEVSGIQTLFCPNCGNELQLATLKAQLFTAFCAERRVL
jgi:predicted amidophosphoribosyltransferase